MVLSAEEKKRRQKEAYQKWAKSAKGKATQKRRNDEYRASGKRSLFDKSAKGKALAKKQYEKKKADPGKLLMLRIGTRMTQAVLSPENSTRLKEWTEFTGHKDCRAHFESTFEDWMNWDNYGPYVKNGPRRWHIGHRIPLSLYRAHKVDMKRCWSKANLKAQCAKENLMQNNTTPPLDVLRSLTAVWPARWFGEV